MFDLLCKQEIRRELKTVDIVKRLSVITPNRIHLKKYPIEHPAAVFNASLVLDDSNELAIYSRIVLGYFTYASAIAKFKVPIEDIYSHLFSYHYPAEIVLIPNTKYDLWGTEDPRVYKIDGKRVMTYCGRTIHYFDPHIRLERTLPVTAVREDKKRRWKKVCACRMPNKIRRNLVSDKDAFFVKFKDKLKLFHRLHIVNDANDEKFFYLVMSDAPSNVLESKKIRCVKVSNTVEVIRHEKFEEKIGWGTPPVKVDKEYLLLLHGVDKDTKCYRVFAILMNDKADVTAITPYYIMKPKEIYERYGDRSYTVFPCGALILDDKLLISYGAADSSIGIGEIDLTKLMSILDSNRVE